MDLGKALGFTLSQSEEQSEGSKGKLFDLITLFTFHSHYCSRIDYNRERQKQRGWLGGYSITKVTDNVFD